MSFYSTCLVVLVVYVPYWILVGTLRHLIKTKKIEHTSDDDNDDDDKDEDDDDNEIDSNSGGMVLRFVAPLPLATATASPLTSPPAASASMHRAVDASAR